MKRDPWLANARVPVLGVAAPSGTGKTTLLRLIIPVLNARGLRVGIVKQSRADFDMDQPGKDSYRLRKAGADRLLLLDSEQSALFLEHPGSTEPQLNDLLKHLEQDQLDLILVEGFSTQAFAKILLRRQAGERNSYAMTPDVVAIATDHASQESDAVPVLDINNPIAIADFILTYLSITDAESRLSRTENAL
ncbi:MAG: molybdopterin-guanine dinucleotide biosynthesis protein B [Candidatus Competibacteraceae bacterium]|jgi:molybdopterin-guanine dinucleotide biosynthesis protein MobB|nr:molybdopterin-guanine dinucleotide biosynthesis protein B [Candidatus Competibacteraceae bacterium]